MDQGNIGPATAPERDYRPPQTNNAKISFLPSRMLGYDSSGFSRKKIDPLFLRRLIQAERARAKVIGGKMLGDPAWDLLLDLLLVSLEGGKVSVSSACIVTGLATTSALRLVNRLVQQKVLIRQPDPDDGRRYHLIIAPHIHVVLEEYFSELIKISRETKTI